MVKPVPLIFNNKPISFRHTACKNGFRIYNICRGQSDFTHTVHSRKKQPICEIGDTEIEFCRCTHRVPARFCLQKICHHPNFTCYRLNRFQRIRAVIFPLASSLCCLSCSVLLQGRLSGPIMRNTCCLTQIENTAR